MADVDHLPTTLIDVIANTVILRQTAPYFPLRSLLALSAVNRAFRDVIISAPEAWRHLDLKEVKSAIIDSSPIDVGGVSWRAERMDEALTEDDFYSGPLRGIFSKLHRQRILRNVHTLILDGLSVPADLVREIVAEDRYNVKILSLRESKNLNQSKLQQVLRYTVRPTRAEGTPKLKALYIFGAKDSNLLITRYQEKLPVSLGVMASEGAQIGAEWNQRSSTALLDSISDDESRWYGRSGRLMGRPQSDWPETLRACKGLIAFDAVLCRGPRHDITKVDSKEFLQPTIATIALGPGGCEICGTCPEEPAIFGRSPEYELPLLNPPPSHSSTVRAARFPTQNSDGRFPALIIRCEDCLRGRWCEQCNRWWCEDCYEEPISRIHLRTEMQQTESRQHLRDDGWDVVTNQGRVESGGTTIKGVHRDCVECGRTCEDCKAICIRRCRICRTEFCIAHDDGCSEHECAWCSRGGRRTRTREMY